MFVITIVSIVILHVNNRAINVSPLPLRNVKGTFVKGFAETPVRASEREDRRNGLQVVHSSLASNGRLLSSREFIS